MNIEFKSLPEVPSLHLLKLVEILQESWGHLENLRAADLKERADRGQASFAAYVPSLGEQPQGIIQTIGLNSVDKLYKGDYHYLMNLPCLSNPKIRVCIDVTSAEEARGIGLAQKLIYVAISNVAMFEPSVDRILTYTPADAVGLHIHKNGAKLAGIKIEHARPGHSEPTVIMTE